MVKPITLHTVQSLYDKCVEEGDCLLWRGYVANRTPQIYHGGRMQPVRRVILDLLGQKPQGGYVTPRCRDHLCVKREHFHVETNAEHHRRMAVAANQPSNKRLRIAKGAATRLARGNKLSAEQVMQIRSSPDTERALAERFQVNRSLIGRIRRGKSWRFTDNPFAAMVRGAA